MEEKKKKIKNNEVARVLGKTRVVQGDDLYSFAQNHIGHLINIPIAYDNRIGTCPHVFMLDL